MSPAQPFVGEQSSFRSELSVDEVVESLRLRRTRVSPIFLACASIPLLLCAIAFGLVLAQATGSPVLAVGILVASVIGVRWIARVFDERSLASQAAALLSNGEDQFGPMLVSIGSDGLRRSLQDSASLLPWNSFDDWGEGDLVFIATAGEVDVTIPKRCMSAPMIAELQAWLDRGCAAPAAAEPDSLRLERASGAKQVTRYSETPAGAARAATFEAGQVSWPRLILFFFVPTAGIETALGLDDQRVLSGFMVVFLSLVLVTRQPTLRGKARRRVASLSNAQRVFDVEVDVFGFTRSDARGVEEWVAWTQILRWSDEGDMLFLRTSGGTTYWFPVAEFPHDIAHAMRSGVENGGGLRLERSWREHFRLMSPQHAVWR